METEASNFSIPESENSTTLSIFSVLRKQAYNLHMELEEFTHVGDPRTKKWFLVKSPTPMIALTLLYLLIVWLGPKIMRNIEPFNFKKILMFYNFSLVSLNLYIVHELAVPAMNEHYSIFKCEMVDESNNENSRRIAVALWLYYISKLIEFLDTIFFILRKKYNQITALHVYHHASMFPVWYCLTKWYPGGQLFYWGVTNSTVHVIMYSYYGLAAMGPKYQKYLWWKKYLTMMQLVQFVVGIMLCLASYKLCVLAPAWLTYYLTAYIMSFLILFGHFYLKTYSTTIKVKTS